MGGIEHESKQKCKESVWQKTPTANLIRYAPKGTYYVRARVRGSILRASLKTTNYKVACYRLGERLRDERGFSGTSGNCPKTLGEALAAVAMQVKNDPSLKASTRRSYAEELQNLSTGSAAAVPTVPLPKLRAYDMEEWWARAAKAYAPQRANHLLGFVRRALKLARESGALFRDPAEKLKPVKIPRTRLKLPSAESFRAIVDSVRAQGKAYSDEAANWIEFMAYSGMRPEEIDALQWSDVNGEEIRVYGGAHGTKNREFRKVPIIPKMAVLLRRMRKRSPATGPLFRIKKPSDALRNACLRVGAQRMRIYDLRHLFASFCCAAGVPMPTLAEWLGHKDGGTLAMRTYIHTNLEHSRKVAKKVKFL